jgi:hypothetical protein
MLIKSNLVVRLSYMSRTSSSQSSSCSVSAGVLVGAGTAAEGLGVGVVLTPLEVDALRFSKKSNSASGFAAAGAGTEAAIRSSVRLVCSSTASSPESLSCGSNGKSFYTRPVSMNHFTETAFHTTHAVLGVHPVANTRLQMLQLRGDPVQVLNFTHESGMTGKKAYSG